MMATVTKYHTNNTQLIINILILQKKYLQLPGFKGKFFPKHMFN